ncbi:replicative DNA helicase [uncultured Weeksella sp.]|uniref:replicative DNA helicase n=1 Tax=uncultured Weeksella sp. TaxID=1161389 RepID=UPI003390508B
MKIHDKNIEDLVLGMMITFPKDIVNHYSKLNHDLFFDKNNQLIYDLIIKKYHDNDPINLVTISVELGKINRKDLDLHIISISASPTSSAHLEYYIMILVELSVKRDFIKKFQSLIDFAKKPDEDIFHLRDKAFQTFENLFIDKFIDKNKSLNTFSQLVNSVEKRAAKIEQGKLTGIKTSLPIINKAMGGWQKSDLTIVAGRPGMGKTAFLVQSVVDVASQGGSCAVFSLEMSSEQITGRIINNITEIPNYSILRKGMNQDEWYKFKEYKKHISSLKIHIDDTPSISINNLRLKAKMFKMRYDIDIIFIDYMQLMTVDRNTNNREQEISLISRSLKALAKELNVPVIALSQLSRKVEERSDKRPLLSDLRESGAIEQDADEVLFLFRPEYYGIDTWNYDYNNETTENQIEIIIQKNRQGGLLSERYGINLPTSKFYTL